MLRRVRSKYLWNNYSLNRLISAQRAQERRGDASAETEVKNRLRPVIRGNKGLFGLDALETVKANTETGVVRVDLNPGVPGHPSIARLKEQCRDELSKLVWVKEISINDTSILDNPKGVNGSIAALANVEHVIAVSSCKGGVGKSTVTVNLAMTLARRGLRVGIVDADVYGPSLPFMIKPEDVAVKRSPTNDKHVQPLVALGLPNLKFLSFGHVNPKAGVAGAGGRGAAIMRGPIVSRVINQLITSTEWGTLDYLLVDMPPGTGDIQITLTQSVSLTGAVVVSTPHTLSLIDAAKGVQMFEDLRVPVLSLVENMSHFTCDEGATYYPFGKGGRKALLAGLQADAMNEGEESVSATALRIQECPFHQFPLAQEASGNIRDPGDDNYTNDQEYSPAAKDSESGRLYKALADDVILEIARQKSAAALIPSLSYHEKRGIVLRYFGPSSVEEYAIPAWEMRDRDPLTGTLLPGSPEREEREQKYKHVVPVKFDIKGNYGVAVIWSDGHYADIFGFDVLREMALELGAST